ncbi:hypothetical protein M407DRAFT_165769 [Tulasnella calospora MUT 4182]|uniref:L-type lectin-like domain-containing protein n=1 Tax=Tulasnella calospora MUT 4182 TaxID=1051891 RepID=A0A0C3QM27_9AGAM|nr:hypothetical protein M407DRAFT_165769 [Tulasnella calospora MUT 4182]
MPRITNLCALLLAATLVFAAKKKEEVEETPETLVPLRTHSIYAPYVDQDLQNRWFDFGGEAYVNTNKHIRLTQDRQSETGWLWSRLPLTPANYQIDIEFKISGGSGHLFGDGMAIWLTKSRAEYGTVFGSKDKFEGVGIFLDTYANARHSYSFPRIMAMIGDGRTSYDLGSDGEKNSAGACSASIRRNDIKTMIRIRYKKDKGLEVLLQYKGWDEWTPCFEIKNMTLPTMPYLGMTAITGEVHDAHDIISIASNSIVLNPPNLQMDESVKKGRKSPFSASKEGEGSWFGTLFKLILLGGVVAGAYQAYLKFFLKGMNKRF